MLDHVRPDARKKPDQTILLAGTNDLTAINMNSIENLKEILNGVKKISPEKSVALVSPPPPPPPPPLYQNATPKIVKIGPETGHEGVTGAF